MKQAKTGTPCSQEALIMERQRETIHTHTHINKSANCIVGLKVKDDIEKTGAI